MRVVERMTMTNKLHTVGPGRGVPLGRGIRQERHVSRWRGLEDGGNGAVSFGGRRGSIPDGCVEEI